MVGRVGVRRTRVAVVFGGRSTEHAISCVSAGSVLAALEPDEFDVVPIGITRQGRWVLARDADAATLAIRGRELPEVTAGGEGAVMLPADPDGGWVAVDPAGGVRALGDVDVVFPVLHGPYGEDGTIQGLLEMAGTPYVGAGVFASAAAMDKEFTKRLAAADGIPVAPYAVLRPGAWLEPEDQQRLGLPVFVKPARAGSSHGVSKVTDWADLEAAVAAARRLDPKVVVEAAVAGAREVECGVLEGEHGGPPETSQPAEIRVTGHEFYDFEAKYLDESACEFDVPARLPEAVTARVRRYAARIFAVLDCAGLARVDFFVTPQLRVLLNEVNTMPGFTPTSLFPRMWADSGLPYPKLVARLVRTALRRAGR